MTRPRPRRLVGVALIAGLLGGCGTAPRVAAPANPRRARLEAALAALPTDAPIALRYNPAPCDCPAFELPIDGGWLRVELVASGNVPEFPRLLDWLGAQPPERWPIGLSLRGAVERELLRTTSGTYAARLDVTAVLGPPEAIAPAAAPEPTSEPTGAPTAPESPDPTNP